MDTILKVQHRISSTLPVRIYRKILGANGKNRGFRLFSLPLELRQQIYGYYFVSTLDSHSTKYHPIEIDKNCNIYCLRKCHTKILTVNRQLYCEARDVLYSETTWHISFNSLNGRPDPEIASTASLQAFRSRPEFGLIKNITVGIMFIRRNEIFLDSRGLQPSQDQPKGLCFPKSIFPIRDQNLNHKKYCASKRAFLLLGPVS